MTKRVYNVALKMKPDGIALLPFDPKRKPGNSVIETEQKIIFVKILADSFSVVSVKDAVFYLFYLDDNAVAAFPFDKVEYITSGTLESFQKGGAANEDRNGNTTT